MADEQLVAEQVGLTRFGRDAQTSAEELGPLADLVGTWIGSRGYELIAVPKANKHIEAFDLIVKPYVEVITFVPIGAPVPDRGGNAGNLFLTGLKYEMRIAALDTNEPLHLENGMWFYMPREEHEIARSSAIPHGDCLLALGDGGVINGPPDFSPLVSADPNSVPKGALQGYTDVYHFPEGAPFDPSDVLRPLRTAAQGLEFLQTTQLDVTTKNPGGGVLNIPFVTAHANATCFESTYWIETVQTKNGQPFMQLQYSQRTDIEFFAKADGPGLVNWPHVNVNTLRKQ